MGGQRKIKKKRLYTPSQARSQRTYECVLQAAARILIKDGIAGFSTNRVSEISGVGVGSIYQYFKNKEDIVETIALRHIDEIRRILSFDYTNQHADVDMLDGLIDRAVEAHLREPELHKAISAIPLVSSAYPKIVKEMDRLDVEVDRFLRSVIRKLNGLHNEKKIRAAALIVYSLVEATVHRAVTMTQSTYDVNVLAGELKQAVKLYLKSLSSR